jgi:hypothetical protein
VTLDDRIAEWLIRRPQNPLRLPEQPRIAADLERDAAFDRLIERGGRIDYRLPYPKHELLARAVAAHGVLLHGSNDDKIEVFEPREQTTYRGQLTNAVFATPDPIWPIFFAIVDRGVANSLWNQCLMELPRTRYFFSVGAEPDRAWTAGAVYLLPGETFGRDEVASELRSPVAVEPRAVLPVTKDDFPFAHLVFRHSFSEPRWRRLWRLVRVHRTGRG